MKNNLNKEEYTILSQNQKSKTYDFNSSFKNRLIHIGYKKLLFILFSLITIIIIVLFISIKFIYGEGSQNKIGIFTRNITNLDFREAPINGSLPLETYTSFENGNSLTYLTKEMVDKFNLYINSCISNTFLDKKKYPLVQNPKITAIIPIYNGGKYLKYSLRSIQNQKMKDIEIIIVDDCSTDDTLTIIEEYMKEDERIRFIKNFENRKILYSKSIAALNSKGKYIVQIDQDDMFIRDDVFDILYYEAQKEDLDLVHIRDICKHNYTFENLTRVNYLNRHFIFPKKTHYKQQPELKDKMYINGNNYLLWGLLIKTDIYKKAIYHLWPIIINYKITFHEDYTITFMLIILAQKYKYLDNFALIHLYHTSSTSTGFGNNPNFYLSTVFFGNTLFDYHINNNPKDIKIFFHYYSYFKSVFNIAKNLFPNLYYFFINKVLNNEYLSYEQKEYFQKKINSKENISENIDEYEFGAIFNYQIAIFNYNKSNILHISDPKISIILLCTENKYIDKTINSIQSQNFSSYEIILIYDNNKQNDINLIQKYVKENPNINLINNKNKKGLVYSISVGVLSSKGKYILILEQSNTFAKSNTLNELYNIISDGNIDILEFNLLLNNHDTINKNSLIFYKCPHLKSQINLDKIKYNQNYKNIDQQKDLLINKLIKADLFKNIIQKYNLNEIQKNLYNYYDDIFLYVLQKSNNNFNQTNTFGVIKNINNTNSLNINNVIQDKNQKINDSLFYINFIFENSDNTFEAKEFVVNEFFNVMSIIYNKFNSNSTESYNLYQKFLNCSYITQIQKNYLQLYYNSLIN